MMETESRSGLGRTLRNELSETGRDLRLASLGVVALLERKGRHVFKALIEEGKTFETRERTRLDRMLQEALGQARVIGRRMETGLQDTSTAVLRRFGIPSHAEITALIARVEQLTAKVEAIGRKEAVDDQEG
jgi:poly(hydroxyalkanoate) granule-associated protein